MNKLTLLFIFFTCCMSVFSQDISIEKIKCIRGYNKSGSLVKVSHFADGELIKRIDYNYIIRSSPGIYRADSVVTQYSFDEVNNIETSIRIQYANKVIDTVVWKELYFFDSKGRTKKVKTFYNDQFSSVEKFKYNTQGDIRKEYERASLGRIYLNYCYYKYSKDSLILKETNRGGIFRTLSSKLLYTYDNNRRLIKLEYYNYDNRLTSTYTYEYNELNLLVKEQEVRHSNAIRAEDGSKIDDEISWISYTYNSEGFLIEKESFGKGMFVPKHTYEYFK